MKKYITYILFSFSILIVSCEKDELTIPVDVDIVVNMESESQEDYLEFYSGEIVLESILFQGERQEGEDVFFTTNPNNNFGPFLFYNNSTSVKITHFDIPQGKYVLINWSFILSSIDEDDDLEEEIEADNDFGLAFIGEYTTLSGLKIPLIIEIEDEERFNINAQSSDGLFEINLIENNTYSAKLAFDLGNLLKPISRESFENADLNSDNQLVISSDENEVLYENILYRLETTSKVIFSKK